MKLLCVSDTESPVVYSHRLRERFGSYDGVISCGDLAYPYLEYIVSVLDRPLYYVNGNHDKVTPSALDETREQPWGATNLHRRVIYNPKLDLLIAGIEGSLVYNHKPRQYSQLQMWLMIFEMIPKLLWNKVRYGRFLDIFISHAPPAGIHDDSDYAHRGVNAFRWLDRWFSPQIHLHGHIHLYMPTQKREIQFHRTRIINAFDYIELEVEPSPKKARLRQVNAKKRN